jgi:aspartate beta-hydroxylase
MTTAPHDGSTLGQQAADALRRGDAAAARELYGQAVVARPGDVDLLFELAGACRALGDLPGQAAAVDRVLALDPHNVQGLVMKGDVLEAAGDSRAASAYDRAALRAAPPTGKVPAALLEDLRRAQARSARHARQYEAHMRAWLAGRGFDPDVHARTRFGQSLDLLLGRKQLFLQEPRYYYFPELPQKQFYDRDDFPWLERVEAATDAIREELISVLDEPGAFAPYVQGDPDRPRHGQQGMLDNPDWSAFYLWRNGDLVPDNAVRCPRTLEALAAAPLARIPNRAPSVLFSQLRAGAHIPPHTGMINTRLICHLPLIVPGKCRFRVGNDVREWQPGRAWVFDDSINHEAWNDADRTRVILLFDIERPELDDEERAFVAALFEGIDAFAGRKPEWEI